MRGSVLTKPRRTSCSGRRESRLPGGPPRLSRARRPHSPQPRSARRAPSAGDRSRQELGLRRRPRGPAPDDQRSEDDRRQQEGPEHRPDEPAQRACQVVREGIVPLAHVSVGGQLVKDAPIDKHGVGPAAGDAVAGDLMSRSSTPSTLKPCETTSCTTLSVASVRAVFRRRTPSRRRR